MILALHVHSNLQEILTPCRRQATGFMIAGAHKYGIMLVDPLQYPLEGFIVCQNLPDLCSRIVPVASMVDTWSLLVGGHQQQYGIHTASFYH